MKKTVVFYCSILSAIFTINTAKADLLDGWDFASLTSGVSNPTTIGATVGTGSLDLSAYINTESTNFSGSTINLFPGSSGTAGQALAIQGSSANNKSMIFSLSMSGYQSLVVTFAGRGTSTGFSTGTWSWSTDGGTTYNLLTGVNTATTSTTFALQTADFTSQTGLNGASSVLLEYTLSGASSTAGNNRLDNIQFNATSLTPAPEPGTLALATMGGVACLLAVRRKK